MSRRDPTDFSLDELQRGLQRLLHQPLSPACGRSVVELFADPEQFPGPDYRDEAGAAFWRADTVRAWVRAYAWAELLSIPGEVEQLTKLSQALRVYGGRGELAPAAARERTLHDFAQVRIKQFMEAVAGVAAKGGQ